MRTAAQRIAKYNARMVSSLLDPVRTALQTQQQANYSAFTTEYVPKQEQLRAILDALGIDTAQYVFYEAYFGELYHVWKTSAGASAVVAATAIEGRWAHASRLGVDAAATLKAIALDCFNIIIP
jgi:ABC-type Zn2+ transport system substrate-binding protein/surface adhesin